MSSFKGGLWRLAGLFVFLGGLLPGRAHATGTISLLPEVTYDMTGGGNRLPFIADLDGDGKMDLLVTTSSRMGFLYGKGDGSFPSTSRASTAIYGAGRATAADLNGDGRLDVVFPYQTTVCVRLNQGLRQFAPMVSYAVGSSPQGVVAADFNGDGRPDIAVANQGSNNLGVLLNHGDGTFAPPVFYPGGTGPVGLVTADFNSDGKADLAMANSGSGDVILYQGDGQGGFAEAGRYATGGADPTLLVTNDFNGDGKPDLAVANTSGNSIAVLLGDGQGGFSQPAIYGGIAHPYDLASGDLDGDGAPDLVVTNGGFYNAPRAPTSFFYVLQSAGNGSFLAPVITDGGLNGTNTVAVGDLNGDGKPDIMIGSVGNYGASGGSDSISVLLTNNPVSPPQNLTLSVPALTQINLAWVDPNSNETGFEVQRQLVGGLWAPLVTLPPNTSQYADLNLAPFTTYLYRVRAFNVEGPSAWSNVAWTQTARPPAAPTDLAVSPTAATQLDLHWTDNSSDESAFEVWRQQGTGASTRIAVLPPNTTHYADTGLTPNTSYSYRIKATGAEGAAWSNTAVGSTPLPPVPPLSPSHLQLSLVSLTQVRLTWTDGSDNETQFEIQRQSPGGLWVPLDSVPANTTSYLDTSVSPLNTYIYRVRAVNATGPSPWWSNEAWIDTVQPPAAPSGLQLKTAATDQPVLAWRDNSDTELAFEVWRKSGAGSYERIDSLPADSILFVDQHLAPGITYTYRVRAISAGGASAWTNEVWIDTVLPLAAPTDLQLKWASADQIVMGWTDNSSNEFAFEVWRKTATSAYQRLQSLAPNTTVFIDPNLTPGTTYTYRVRATGAQGASAWTNEVSWTVP
jgi:hypothetical protein